MHGALRFSRLILAFASTRFLDVDSLSNSHLDCLLRVFVTAASLALGAWASVESRSGPLSFRLYSTWGIRIPGKLRNWWRRRFRRSWLRRKLGESFASSSEASGSSSAADGIGFDLDLEEGWLLVIAVIALIGGLIASLYIIYIAPALLAEILVDGVLVAGLYRRVKHIEQRHWLRAAVRRTFLPALLCATLFAVAGYAMQKAFPEAHSIGDVWKHIT